MTPMGIQKTGPSRPLHDNLSQFQARLPSGTQGELGINVTAGPQWLHLARWEYSANRGQ